MKSTARMEKRVDDPKLIEMAEAVASLVTLLKQPIRWFSAETHAQSLEKWCGDAVSRATVEDSVKAHHDRPWYKRAWHWLWNTEGIRSQQDAWRCWQWISLFNPLLSDRWISNPFCFFNVCSCEAGLRTIDSSKKHYNPSGNTVGKPPFGENNVGGLGQACYQASV